MKSPEAYDLDRKGPMDQKRHQEKVKEAIKENLKEIVGEESIITSDGQRIVRVPIKSLDLPDFRYGFPKKGVGQGEGDTQVGDIIGQIPGDGKGPGRGKQAGDQPGVDYYDAEVTVDEIIAMAFEDMGLPFLLPKGGQLLPTDEVQFNEIRKKGPLSNLDKKRTLLSHLKRQAMEGREPKIGKITDDDLRFKTWEYRLKPTTQAVVVAMRDNSDSMGEFEKYITRTYFAWMVKYLRTRYSFVEIVFITHHTEAHEVDEEAFFYLGESGGTKCSSAYELANEIIDERFPVADWNIYPIHFSDGDNWGDVDNQRCLELIEQLLEKSNAVGYGEIQEGSKRSMTTLMSTFQKIKNQRFIAMTITQKSEVYPALKTFFRRDRVLGKEFEK